MPKILIPLADGFEEIEALTLVDVLRRADIEVITASIKDIEVQSARKVIVKADITIDEINEDDFDMIILPGGQPGTDNLNADNKIQSIIKKYNSSQKMIGAICAAPYILHTAGILKERRVTSYPTYQTRIPEAIIEEGIVIEDGNIITSQGPGTALHFALHIVKLFKGEEAAENLEKAMIFQKNDNDDVWGERLFNSTIQALVGALEMKDTYTQGHAKRVTEYALSIGNKLNLNDKEMRDLYLGAVLHDIGKIGTDDDVLNKPDRLNLHEEILVREHPLKGTLFIVGIENLSHIVPTILHHHEKWDGTGYPGRLKGEQIPLHARIVCVADAFDAMHSARSYRPALEKDVCIKELKKQSGTQFDPFLVDVFIECINDSPFEMKDFSYYFY